MARVDLNWFAVTLLAMLAGLMASHLGLLWLGALECDAQARILIAEQRQDLAAGTRVAPVEALHPECSKVKQAFEDAAETYTSIILALLTGAGAAVGATRRDRQ